MSHFTRPMILLGLVSAAASGCVVYENDHAGNDGYDEDYTYGDDGVDDSGDVDATPELAMGFHPDQAEQGEAFLGYLSVSEGELDFDTVEAITFYGDVELQDFDVRDDEIILSVAVSPDAVTGDVDILLEFGGNQAFWAEGVLTIYEADSGHSCDDAEDDGVDGDGNAAGDDGDGDGSTDGDGGEQSGDDSGDCP